MEYICFDTETTGLSPKSEKLIEIAAVKVDNCTGKIVDKYHTRICPVSIVNGERVIKKIGKGAQSVHNISNDDVKDSPTFSEVAPEFIQFISNAPIIAHNIRFDVGFIMRELNELDDRSLIFKFASTLGLDTLKYSRDTYGYSNSLGNSLDSLASRFDVSLEDRTIHGALIDSIVLANIMIKIPNKEDIPTKYCLDWVKDQSFIKDKESWYARSS